MVSSLVEWIYLEEKRGEIRKYTKNRDFRVVAGARTNQWWVIENCDDAAPLLNDFKTCSCGQQIICYNC